MIERYRSGEREERDRSGGRMIEGDRSGGRMIERDRSRRRMIDGWIDGGLIKDR